MTNKLGRITAKELAVITTYNRVVDGALGFDFDRHFTRGLASFGVYTLFQQAPELIKTLADASILQALLNDTEAKIKSLIKSAGTRSPEERREILREVESLNETATLVADRLTELAND